MPKRGTRIAGTLLLVGLCHAAAGHAQVLFGERRYDYRPADVLPAATEFVRTGTYWEGYGPGTDGPRTLQGYVVLTDDLVEIPGYSGHSINTLVGIDPTGTITGVKVVRHSEPIVLIGLSEQVIHDFVAQYVGKEVRRRIIISNNPSEGYVAVDGISGATVTAVAENATILEAGRRVGRMVGFVAEYHVRTRRPSDRFAPQAWKELVAAGAIGRIVVEAEDVGLAGPGPALDLKFAVLDPPSIGRNLLGERYDKIVRDRLHEDGGSALFVGADGALSFKGAGFARGGIFDRFSVEQNGDLFVFKDTDYLNLPDLPGDENPAFREGGVFFLANPGFDPAEPFTFHLTLPYRLGNRRAYGTFLANYELPGEFVARDLPFWATRWQASAAAVSGFALFLAAAATVFAFRQRLVARRKLLHYTVAAIAAVWVGLVLKAQPSTTQILTLTNSTSRLRFPYEIFLSEPLIFLFWVGIAVSMVFWGRGFFCGWLCPYGALLESLVGLWRRIVPERLRQPLDAWEPGPFWRSGKYVTFLVILAVSFVSLPAADALDEVEPFKTFILRLARPGHFVAYFAAVTLASMIVYRSFCRFLCPLGGAVAIPGRQPFLPLVRYDRCTTCKICYRGCDPKAISSATGRIDYRECLQCWDCQMTAQDEAVCPALIVARQEGRAPRLMLGIVLLLAGLLGPQPAAARTWVVGPGPDAIGAAIAASADGDTIRVEPGLYAENVVVGKPLTIIGVEGAVVDARGSGHVLVVDAPGVRVEGLTLRNSGNDLEISEAGIRVEKRASDAQLIGNRIEGCRFGIWIHGSERATMIGNRIAGMSELDRNARGDCIHLWDARDAAIRENVVSDCRDGIYLELSTNSTVTGNTISDSRYAVHTMWCDRSAYNENLARDNLVGLALMFSKHIEAKGNTLYSNATHGLLLTQVTRSEAAGNLVIGNTKGLFVYNSLYNTIRENFVARNNLGLHYWGGSEENELADNTFMANQIQVKFVAAHDQVWNGNFWSDYVGWDTDGNGRGDTPYRSNTLVDALLWEYPMAKLLLATPALQVLALAEREFPVIAVPKGVDHAPRMAPLVQEWVSILERHPPKPQNYYGRLEKLPHIPGG